MITINASQLQRLNALFGKTGSAAQKRLFAEAQAIGFDIVACIKMNQLNGNPIKHRTGRLSNAVTSDVRMEGGRVVATVGLRKGFAPYGAYLEFGTRPHIIRAIKARALRFAGSSGGTIFRRQVNHPGNRAFSFVRGTVGAMRHQIVDRLRSAAFPRRAGDS